MSTIYKAKIDCGCCPDSELHPCPCASANDLGCVGFIAFFSFAISWAVTLSYIAYIKPCWFYQVIC